MPTIVQLHDWPAVAIERLLVESEQEGFRFVRRAEEEWLSGVNRFSKDGEALFGIFEGDRILAIGGINRASPCHGRLRRLYVCRESRGQGMGRQLVGHVLDFSKRHYNRVELRCDTDAADRFYRAVGFRRADSDPDITHAIDLQWGRDLNPV